MEKRALLWLLVLGFLKNTAQLYPHIYSYQRAYTLVNHLSQQGLFNQLYSGENLQEWDTAGGTFRSYIPASLQYKNVAGKTVSVSIVKMEQNPYFFYTAAQQLPEINSRLLDSLFKNERLIETLQLAYDESGRLTKRSRIVLEYPQYIEKDTTWFSYGKHKDSLVICVRSRTYSRSEKGGYSSVYAGDFKTGPVIRVSAGSTILNFNSKDLLSSYSVTHSQYANGIKDYREEDHLVQFTWNEKGLLLRRFDSIKGKGPAVIKNLSYKEGPFNLETEQGHFLLLKTPAIKRWLKKDFRPGSLSMLYLAGAGDYDTDPGGVYIMHNKIVPLMRIENPNEQYGQMSSDIFARLQDSSGAYRVHYHLMKLPDVNDTLPYTANLSAGFTRPHYTDGTYTRPHGLIDAASTTMVKQREVVLKNGWKVLVMEKGSDGEKPFVPGLAPFLQIDPSFTEFIFVDPGRQPKYFYENKRLYKIMY